MSRTYRSDDKGRKLRRYDKVRFPDGAPRWWRKTHMTRPLRHANRRGCNRVLRGMDVEAALWPPGNHKPHVYYW